MLVHMPRELQPWPSLLLFVAVVGCSSSGNHATVATDGSAGGAKPGPGRDGGGAESAAGGGNKGQGGANGESGRTSAGADGGSRGSDGGNSATPDAGVPTSCEPFGHYGAPGKTFALPTPTNGSLYYPDVQKSFPAVDWANLDRLYVPSGKYKEFNLGNLPKRSAAHPLVITNQGGRVQVGPNLGANYIWSMGGGSHWILTGRYDPDSGTGDASVPGHRCGDYARSRGRYGFLSDDAFDTSAPYLHMGVSVAAASDFEIEYVEVERSGFAGIRLLNSRKTGEAALDMANVRIHDNYVHDTDAEGTYFGWTGAPPANLLPGLAIYNNRFIRTGNEALQIQDLGDGTEVHHNVIAFAGLHFRDNGLGKYQDNNSQIQTREGTISVHDNVILGGAGTLISFWSQPESIADGLTRADGDRHVTFASNYLADTKSLLAYMGGDATTGSDFHFLRNFFRGMDFTYTVLDPSAKDPGVVIQISPTYQAPIELTGNTWEGPNHLTAGLPSGNGTTGTVTASANVNAAVAPVEFENSGYPAGKSTQSLEIWAAKATVDPAAPAITYAPGALVMANAEMYECTKASTNEPPAEHPESWKKLATPVDDVRVKTGTAYAGLGVH
jgi:hypothetical protein